MMRSFYRRLVCLVRGHVPVKMAPSGLFVCRMVDGHRQRLPVVRWECARCGKVLP